MRQSRHDTLTRARRSVIFSAFLVVVVVLFRPVDVMAAGADVIGRAEGEASLLEILGLGLCGDVQPCGLHIVGQLLELLRLAVELRQVGQLGAHAGRGSDMAEILLEEGGLHQFVVARHILHQVFDLGYGLYLALGILDEHIRILIGNDGRLVDGVEHRDGQDCTTQDQNRLGFHGNDTSSLSEWQCFHFRNDTYQCQEVDVLSRILIQVQWKKIAASPPLECTLILNRADEALGFYDRNGRYGKTMIGTRTPDNTFYLLAVQAVFLASFVSAISWNAHAEPASIPSLSRTYEVGGGKTAKTVNLLKKLIGARATGDATPTVTLTSHGRWLSVSGPVEDVSRVEDYLKVSPPRLARLCEVDHQQASEIAGRVTMATESGGTLQGTVFPNDTLGTVYLVASDEESLDEMERQLRELDRAESDNAELDREKTGKSWLDHVKIGGDIRFDMIHYRGLGGRDYNSQGARARVGVEVGGEKVSGRVGVRGEE